MLTSDITRSPTVSGDFSDLKVSFSSTSFLVCITDFSACLSPSVCRLPSSPSVYWPLLSACLLIRLPRCPSCPSCLVRPNLVLRVFFFYLSPTRTCFPLGINQFTSLLLQSPAPMWMWMRLRTHAGVRPFLINPSHLAQHPHEWRRVKPVPVKLAVYSPQPSPAQARTRRSHV